ncbi:MAG: ubiquinol-cytochrome c reductase iron-sulfur subunit [Rhodoferax sp.]|nr:ubiquinol-cytochrome c reductase iron-sulfur subunit [Rhodoferax sp.]
MLAGLGAATVTGVAGVWRWQRGPTYPQGAPLQVDVSSLPAGQLLTVQWNQRPVWVLRRSPADLATLVRNDNALTDARSEHSAQPPGCVNLHRSLDPALLVAVGLCTHQGCTPMLQAGVGFTCPCHASRYDLAGRVFKQGPAPANLVIPAYHLAADGRLVLGALA